MSLPEFPPPIALFWELAVEDADGLAPGALPAAEDFLVGFI